MRVSTNTDLDEIDLTVHPYRGVLAEVGRILGISRQAVRKSRSPRVRRAIISELKARQETHREFARLLGADVC